MVLDKIVEAKQIRLKEQKKIITLHEMIDKSQKVNRKKGLFYDALTTGGISIIGEFKKASPSLGKIESRLDFTERIQEYQESVDAISCLTEEDFFLGSVKDFEEIRAKTELPMIRKDFMIEEYQFYEAKAIGADAVLLIAAILEEEKLKSFYQLSKELDLDALVEVHNEEELEGILKLDVDIIGINNRDLTDFTINLETTKRLAGFVPKDKVLVSESGITKEEDIRYLKESQVDAFLIGRALMEAKSPRETASAWRKL